MKLIKNNLGFFVEFWSIKEQRLKLFKIPSKYPGYNANYILK